MLRLTSIHRFTARANALAQRGPLHACFSLVRPGFRAFSVSNSPGNNGNDAAEAYPMSITYQKDILKEFKKREKEKYLQLYEDELYQKSLEGVFPDIVNKEELVQDTDNLETSVGAKIKEINTLASPTFPTSERFYITEDDDDQNSEYLMMIAHQRLKFKMGRFAMAERKLKLRKLIRTNLK
ncbi:unnamed protein product [Moneuplotes crassus]|uniref:Uncharacterized protein n=1 Tax=Euplotes crassus TaxID=5936 RepID=A0AAD1XZH7_EUPCR|nr:unnamed protein product [Moneuplotes crassus]